MNTRVTSRGSAIALALAAAVSSMACASSGGTSEATRPYRPLVAQADGSVDCRWQALPGATRAAGWRIESMDDEQRIAVAWRPFEGDWRTREILRIELLEGESVVGIEMKGVGAAGQSGDGVGVVTDKYRWTRERLLADLVDVCGESR